MIYILCYRAKKLLEVIFAQMNRKIIATYKIYIKNFTELKLSFRGQVQSEKNKSFTIIFSMTCW